MAALARNRESSILNAKIVRLGQSSITKRQTVKPPLGSSDAEKSVRTIGGVSVSKSAREEQESSAGSPSWNAKIVRATAVTAKEVEAPPVKSSWNAKVVVHRSRGTSANSSPRRDSASENKRADSSTQRSSRVARLEKAAAQPPASPALSSSKVKVITSLARNEQAPRPQSKPKGTIQLLVPAQAKRPERAFEPERSEWSERREQAEPVPALELANVNVRFGGISALADVSFTIPNQRITGIIGPNGAGKSTLINVISRYLRPDSGEVRLRGQQIRDLAPHQLARIGMARTFQRTQLYPAMTVLQNLTLAGYAGARPGLLQSFLRPRQEQRSENELTAAATAVLNSIGLSPLADKPAGTLPHGQQRIVEVCRALVLRPKVLLLDEPAGGMNREEIGELAALLRQLRDDGTAVVLVEHVMPLVMSVCDKIVVLNFGRKLTEGTPSSVRRDPAVIEAYLGEGPKVVTYQ